MTKLNHRILHIGPDSNAVGGIETVIRTYAGSQWANLDMDVSASTRAATAFGALQQIVSSLKKIRSGDYDVVHAHLSQKGSFVREGLLLLASPKATRRVATIHGSSFVSTSQNAIWRAAYRFVLDRIEAVGVLNNEALDRANSLGPNCNARVLPNPGPLAQTAATSAKSSPPTFVFAGKVGYRKGIDTLISAWEKVEEARPGMAVLQIAGPIDHSTSDDVLQKVKKYYVGCLEASEVAEHLRVATAAVLPSTGEGQPMFLIEALAMGTPLIVTDVGGMSDLAESCGFVVPMGDARQLAQVIVDLIDAPEVGAPLQENAREKYMNTFSVRAHTAALMHLYGGDDAKRT